MPSLWKIWEMCESTVLRRDKDLGSDRAVRAAFGEEDEHLALAVAQVIERAVAPFARDDGRVDHTVGAR
jgi:hypothetical protein